MINITWLSQDRLKAEGSNDLEFFEQLGPCRGHAAGAKRWVRAHWQGTALRFFFTLTLVPSLFRYVVVLPNHPCRWSSPLAWIIWRLWRAPFCFCIFWQVALVRWNETKFANQNWSIDTSESVEHLHLLMRKKCRTVCRTQPQISNYGWISCTSCVKVTVVAVAKTASTPRSGPRYQVLLAVAPWEQVEHRCHDIVPQLAHLSAEEGQGRHTHLLG